MSSVPRRKSPRHPMLDYAAGGYWHIVFCTTHMIPLLGRFEGQELSLSGWGRLLETELLALPDHFSGLTIDCYCIMPNHVHVLFLLNGLDRQRPDLRRVIQRLKSIVGGRYVRWRIERDAHHLPEKLFQRSFRDSYIANEGQLETVRAYIRDNPLALSLDPARADTRSAPTP